MTIRILLPLCAIAALSACSSTQNGLLAVGTDSAVNNTDTLDDNTLAVAVLPDGCQAYIADDGAEGYAVNRYDPRSGLPVCSDRLPPGAVIGNPQTTGFIDLLP